MKKLLTILLLLTGITMVHAQTDYHIKVKGVRVTSANASDVFGDGTVKYIDSGAILEFHNANLTYSSKVLEFEESYDRNVRVYFYGNNVFTCTAASSSVIGSYSPYSLTLFGKNGGTLKIKGAAYGIYLSKNFVDLDILDLKLNIENTVATGYGIYAGGQIRIQSSSVNISTGQYGIRHVPSAEKQLRIVSSDLTIKATGADAYGIFTNSNSIPHFQSSTIDITTSSTAKGAFYSSKEPEFSDVHFDTGSSMTSSIKYDPSLHGYYNSSSTKALVKSLKILPGEYYDIKVKGVEVTSVNENAILGNATVKYDSYTNTLTLNGANFSASSNAIQLGKSVKINVVGTNTISSSLNGIYSTYPFEITGTGTLNVTSTATSNYAPVNLYSSSNVLTVSGGVTVNLKGSQYGLRYGKLVVNKSVMNVHGNTEAFNNVSGLTLDDSQITGLYYNNKAGMYGNPMSADGTYMIKYDASTKKFKYNGSSISEVIQDVEIGCRRFGLKIAGKHVDVKNCNDVLGDGKVSYQETGNKLYIKNANISSSTYAIYNDTKKELSVYFSGQSNNLVNTDGAAIYTHYNHAPVHIYGENLDTYVLLKGTEYGVYATDPISISNIHCAVNTTAYNSKGIYATSGLNVSNARLDVSSDEGYFTGILGYGKISNNSEVNIKASSYGTRGIHVQWGNLEVDGSNVDISSKDAAVYCTQGTNLVLNPNVRINEVSTYDDYYYQPSNISMNDNAISDGINVCLGLKIGSYSIPGIKVAGKQVTSRNMNDILGDGTTSFDPSTYTLCLDNTRITDCPSGKNAVEIINPGKDVTIATNNYCYLEGSAYGLYVREANVTIKGNSIEDGHRVQFTGTTAGASIANSSTLTLDNSYSIFYGDYWGLKALPTCTLNLVHSKCHCYGVSQEESAGSLRDFKQINYANHIINPSNPAKIIDGTAYYDINGPIVRASWVMIEPMASGDIDGNGQVEVKDVKTLHEKLLRGDLNDPSADINGDGKVTILDIVLLNKLLLQKNK